jgi:hypothetical protein
MPSRTDIAALAGAAGILFLAGWFDSSVIAHRPYPGFDDPSLAAVGTGFAFVALGGASLAVGWLGARASALVGLFYVLVGGLFAGGFRWLEETFGAWNNNAPPVLPDPIVSLLVRIRLHTQGPLAAVAVIGGAMVVAGIVAIVRSWRDRRVAAPLTPAAQVPGRP